MNEEDAISPGEPVDGVFFAYRCSDIGPTAKGPMEPIVCGFSDTDDGLTALDLVVDGKTIERVIFYTADLEQALEQAKRGDLSARDE